MKECKLCQEHKALRCFYKGRAQCKDCLAYKRRLKRILNDRARGEVVFQKRPVAPSSSMRVIYYFLVGLVALGILLYFLVSI